MTTERIMVIFAGFMIMLSVLLSHYHHPYWLFFTAFIGLNLFQSGFTGFCPLNLILQKGFGVPSCSEKARLEQNS